MLVEAFTYSSTHRKQGKHLTNVDFSSSYVTLADLSYGGITDERFIFHNFIDCCYVSLLYFALNGMPVSDSVAFLQVQGNGSRLAVRIEIRFLADPDRTMTDSIAQFLIVVRGGMENAAVVPDRLDRLV